MNHIYNFVGGIGQELLSWYDEQGNRYLSAEEIAKQERQRVEQLEQYLRSLGVDL